MLSWFLAQLLAPTPGKSQLMEALMSLPKWSWEYRGIGLVDTFSLG